MSKFLQKIIVISILVITFSISYYFIIFLPNEKNIENERKCQDAGKVLHKNDIGNNSQQFVEGQNEGRFKFDKEHRRCLYMGGFIYKNGTIQRYIKNVYTNEILAEFMGNIHEPDFKLGDKDAFEEMERKYFK